HDVAGLPGDLAAVMDVVAAALDHVEHGAVEMAVLLAEGAGTIGLDVGLDRLGDLRVARRDADLAVVLGTALPGLGARVQHARLLEQLLGQVAIGAFERADERPLLLPAFPNDRPFTVVAGWRLIGARPALIHR